MERIFIPGSEWLYMKIYTGQKSADGILANYLRPFILRIKKDGLCDRFFFIRYSDPDFHIRVRLHIPDTTNYGQVFSMFYETFNKCASNHLITNITCDTYKREIERYGADLITTVEEIFFVDSEAQLDIIKAIMESNASDDYRWRLSLIFVNDIMNAFNLNLESKLILLEKISYEYRREFGFTSSKFTKQLNDKYRLFRQDIVDTLSSDSKLHSEYNKILSIRLECLSVISLKIKNIDFEKHKLIADLIHMTMNRLFRSNARLHEMVIYEFLRKHYKSKIALQIKKKLHI